MIAWVAADWASFTACCWPASCASACWSAGSGFDGVVGSDGVDVRGFCGAWLLGWVVAEAVTASACASSSVASWAFARARVASASVTSASSAVVSRRASTCPCRTRWPAETETFATVPDVPKPRSRRPVAVTVPERSRVRSTSPRAAVAVLYDASGARACATA